MHVALGFVKQAGSGRVIFDFDGVINPYTGGWKGVDVIPEAPRPEAVKLIMKLKKSRTPMAIASARANSAKGKKAIEDYLAKHGLPSMKVYPKPSGVVYVDDRGYKHKSWRGTARAIAKARG